MKNLEKQFKESIQLVSEVLGILPNQISRDLYVRTAVDYDIQPRLSCANLHKLGGFAHMRSKMFGESKVAPKVLVFDIETSPMVVYTWGLFDLRVAPSQILEDWSVLSYAAKWLDGEEVYYEDTSKNKNPRDDSTLLSGIWKLLDDADIVITHNGTKFDSKKLNARFIQNGFQPPSKYRHFDTYRVAKSKFGFTSNKLEYITDKLNTNSKKSQHGSYPGFALWSACLKGDKNAWKEMKEYNIMDVISLEETARKLMPWDNSINWSIYSGTEQCSCGSTKLTKNGYHYTNSSKFQKYRCNSCGAEFRDKKNALEKWEKDFVRPLV